MDILAYLEIYFFIFISDFLRYFTTAGLAYLMFWKLFDKVLINRWIQPKIRSSAQLIFEFKYSMSTVFIFALVGWMITIAHEKGLTQVYLDMEAKGIIWFFSSIVIMILIHDFYFYLSHRLMHQKWFFKHIHLVHHRSKSPSPWAAYSFHPAEALIEAAIFPVFVLIIPAHPLALFIFLAYMMIRNVIGHLGIEILPAWFIDCKWINWHTTPTHHDMHHQYFNCNFGLYFTWWDRIFATEHDNYVQKFSKISSQKLPLHKSTILSLFRKLGQFLSPNSGFITLFAIALAVNFSHGQDYDVVGEWLTFDEESGAPISNIIIEESNGVIIGKISKLYLSPEEDPDPICTACKGDNHNQFILGMTIIKGFAPEGSKWTGGTILDPENGKIYKSSIWIEKENELRVRGYGGPFNLFHRTQLWKRLH